MSRKRLAKVLNKDLEGDEECGICMENGMKMVLPNCGHSLVVEGARISYCIWEVQGIYRERRSQIVSCEFGITYGYGCGQKERLVMVNYCIFDCYLCR